MVISRSACARLQDYEMGIALPTCSICGCDIYCVEHAFEEAPIQSVAMSLNAMEYVHWNRKTPEYAHSSGPCSPAKTKRLSPLVVNVALFV